MVFYSIATQWNTEKTLDIIDMSDELNKINDVYGALPFSPIGHGRSPFAVPHITAEEAKEHIKAVQQKGVTFNYLLNGNFDSQRLKQNEFLTKTLKYIEFVIHEFVIDFVTVAVPELIEILNREFPELKVKLSTVRNVLSKEDLMQLKGLKFQKVTLGNDAPRNFDKLKGLLKYSEEQGIELEMMISETCLYQCPTRQIHYRKQTRDDVDYSTDWYMNKCTCTRIFHPEELFKACWVRPEDLDIYVQLGLKNFKISGRSKSPEWTKRCLSAYFSRNFSGNLMEVLGTTPPDYENNSDHLFYIDNKSLELFLVNHPKNCLALDCEKCRYCLDTAIRLFMDGKFKINKICGSYEVKNGNFICNSGPYTNMLLNSIKANKGL